jgi:hypothetical protein
MGIMGYAISLEFFIFKTETGKIVSLTLAHTPGSERKGIPKHPYSIAKSKAIPVTGRGGL